MEHPIYYVIDGNKSVKMTSTAQNNTLTYPQTMDAGLISATNMPLASA